MVAQLSSFLRSASIQDASSSLSHSPSAENHAGSTGHRGDVSFIVSRVSTTNNYTGTTGWTEGHNSLIHSLRFGIHMAPLYRNGVDTAPGTLACSSTTQGYIRVTGTLAGCDATLGFVDTPQVGSGTGTTLTAPSMTLTKRSRVIRVYCLSGTGADQAIAAISPLRGQFQTATNSTIGADFSMRFVDDGDYEIGTVPALATTISTSHNWIACTVAFPIREVRRPIHVYGSGSWSFSSTNPKVLSTTTILASLSSYGFAFQENDLFVVIGHDANSGEMSSSNPNYVIEHVTTAGLGSPGVAVAYLLWDGVSAIDSNFTFGGTNRIHGLNITVWRDVDVGTPIVVATTADTTVTMTAPSQTVTTRDVSLYHHLTAGAADTAPVAPTDSTTVKNQWNSTGSAGGTALRGLYGFADPSAGSYAPPTSDKTLNTSTPHVSTHIVVHGLPVVAGSTFNFTGTSDSEFDADAAMGPATATFDFNSSLTTEFNGVPYKPSTPPTRDLIWVYGYDGEKVSVVD